MIHGKETPDDVSESYVDQQVQEGKGATVYATDMEVFSVAYVTDSITR
jgi:hypothetical protein